MKYFESLPYITTSDNNGNFYSLKNILIRTELKPELAKNPLLLYQYEVREGDTPESIAHKYYGDPYRYWMVLYSNSNVVDPQGDWPKTSKQFILYLKDKYSTAAGGPENVLSYTLGTVHHYEKIITTFDNETQTTAIKTIEIDENTYTPLQTYKTTQTFANGSSATYEISKNAISIYDYENNSNEAKRNISLINANFANQMETQYQTLVKA